MGNVWSKIAEELGRTPENCRDKIREIGGLNPEKRKKGKWELDEKLELIRIVNSYCDTPFLKRQALCEYKDPNSLTFKQNPTDKDSQLLEKGFKKKVKFVHLYREFELNDIIDLLVTDPEDVPANNLPWTQISAAMVICLVSLLYFNVTYYFNEIYFDITKPIEKCVSKEF